ncbi:Serine/threonine-protein kinase, Ulk1/Ulk2 [Penicillium camemberti]|uniref:Serine/threonine-protein kinase, Ulk1/Ulk2 n=1 Tax=Penicillium camemberti (strain FM 013) TaxID=1429867 RepID=A0A0G4PCS9_PENC3|nr:Serine/threonine-protein kinase, Ulk1/Ulk2 [Penicillium camemberti]
MLASSSPALRASHFCKSLTYLNPLRRTSISGSKPLFHRTTSTISRNPLLSTQHTGLSGRTYTIEHVLQEEVSPPRQVYRASTYIHPVNFEDLQEVNNRLRGNASHVRLAVDTIPDKSMFVFEHFTDHLLTLAQKDFPITVIKRILKNALTGLAELHDRDIVHTDIKADNVFVNWQNWNDEILVDQVQLGDLEDAAHIPQGCDMVGKQAGNWMWRSPEAHARGPVNKPSDIFSFALVCICAVHKRIIFAVREDELEEGVDPLAVVIERQVSYFADEDGLNGFLKHLGDNPWIRVFEATRDGFNRGTLCEPFAFWNGVDDDFKSLVCAMTHFDPGKRITARQALGHKWLEGV